MDFARGVMVGIESIESLEAETRKYKTEKVLTLTYFSF
jgi:hypothetical protein